MKNKKKTRKRKYSVKEDHPSRASFHTSSSTHGGSNSGQGSLGLGRSSLKQGEELNDGSTYKNEPGWNKEALRMKDEDQ